jgi:hypothetical protein
MQIDNEFSIKATGLALELVIFRLWQSYFKVGRFQETA